MRLKKTASLLMASTIMFSSAFSNSSVSAANHARVGVHDPSIVKLEDGSYYIAGSHLAAARSKDLGSWTFTANSNAGTKNTTFFKDIYTDLAVPAAWSSRHPIKIMICQETFGHRILFTIRCSVNIACI